MFSVVMPVWNRAHIVGTAIESVLSQSFTDFELLIVDDGSDDDLYGAVQPYLADVRVRYFQIAHSGVGGARNFALGKAAGDFIAYLDSDNVWHGDYLAKMHDALACGTYDAAYCLARRFCKGDDGSIVQDGCIGRDFSFQDLIVGNFIDANTFVHSKRMYHLKGGFDVSLKRLNDWDLIIRYAGWGEIIFVPEELVDYYFCVEENAITLCEDLTEPLETIKRRYQNVSRPVTIYHDTIPYVWHDLPDRKFRNFWRSLQPDVINRVDGNPLIQPLILQIEPTNTCNLKCPICPVALNTLGRPPRHMSLDEFRKIVDDVADHAMLLVLWDWGEPFMNPQLADMIAYAASRDIRTVTCTNAHFLQDRPRLEKILVSGLNTLIVAIDSLHGDTYRQYRKDGSLDQAMTGLRAAIATKRESGSATTINFRMVAMRSNEHEVWRMERLARTVGADVFSVKTVSPGFDAQQRDSEFVPKNPAFHRLAYNPGTWERIAADQECIRVWIMANILSDGSVVPCCYDYDGSMKLGNVFETPFQEIWGGGEYATLRTRIQRDKCVLPKCAICQINYQFTPQGMFFRSVDFRALRGLDYHVDLLRARMRTFRQKLAGSLARKRARAAAQAAAWCRESGAGGGASTVFPLTIPLAPDRETGWKPYPLFSMGGGGLLSFAAHVSVLNRGACPHPPHSHGEEELLVLLAGEVNLLIADAVGSETVHRIPLQAGQLVYYPAGCVHSLETTSASPANYFMLKWTGRQNFRGAPLPHGCFDLKPVFSADGEQSGFTPRLVFEGPTGYLDKLRCHGSTLSPGAGYEPHADPYDVVIMVLEGEVETLGRRVLPHGVIYYRAGEPHGMANPGSCPARYLVFELHH